MSSTVHQYPGLGLPIRYWPPSEPGALARNIPPAYPLGSHPNVPGSNSVLLPVREVAMMAVMDQLTDKPEWYRKVFDDEIVGKWKVEVMAVADDEWMGIAAAPGSDWVGDIRRLHFIREDGRSNMITQERLSVEGWGIMSDEAFDYCIEELRSKAHYYEKVRYVPTIDASAAVVKSDVLVSDEVRDGLRRAFYRLRDDQSKDPDWHPNSGDMVQDLVHPSMYPLVYGRSKVFRDEVVGVSDAIDKWAGKGEMIEGGGKQIPRSYSWTEIPANYWSETYQWLPSNVTFQHDGRAKLTSYINNLHPTKYPEIYATVEELINTVTPVWDQCLASFENYRLHGPGRKGSRFAFPDGPDDEEAENWIPSDPADVADAEVDLSQDYKYDWIDDEAERKWKILRKPALREPGPYLEVDYDPYTAPEGEKSSQGGLFRRFKDSGLQVIVKMASIELTPEKPEFPTGGWHIEGLLNEKISATALYYLDSENVTDSSLAFRMQTSYDQDELQSEVGQENFHWLECSYGAELGSGGSGSCIQNYGSVGTPESRLLAFPNVFQHRVSPFKLKDPTKPGHRRFIALWLVDPHTRILSTANVPPQQQDWWAESTFGRSADSLRSAADKLPAEVLQLLREKGVALEDDGSEKTFALPPELLDVVRDQFSLDTMSLQEARDHRLRLMEERTAHQGTAQETWARTTYSFCEH